MTTGSADLYPWLQPQWEQLCRARTGQRLPHALLISGPQGMGKRALAQQWSAAMLCARPLASGHACGQCSQCQLGQSGHHPDFIRVEPEEAGKAIKVDQIRAFCASLTLKSHSGGYKVALIHPVEQMNPAAANSLLKTLEEPTDNTLIILVSEQPGRLMATVRSRCQHISILAPEKSASLDWVQAQGGLDAQRASLFLELAAGAPLQSLALAADQQWEQRETRLQQLQAIQAGQQDPVTVAAQWSKESDTHTLIWLQGWISDMIRLVMAGQDASLRNRDLQISLSRLAGRLDTQTLYAHLDRVAKALRLSATGVNRQLMLEEILVAWAPAHEKRPQGNKG